MFVLNLSKGALESKVSNEGYIDRQRNTQSLVYLTEVSCKDDFVPDRELLRTNASVGKSPLSKKVRALIAKALPYMIFCFPTDIQTLAIASSVYKTSREECRRRMKTDNIVHL